MSARFAPGARVRIADRTPPIHHRVPTYAKGRLAVVERVCPAFGQPELYAEGGDGRPFVPLYRVRIAQRDLWQDYAGAPHDKLELEVFEHWLEPAS